MSNLKLSASLERESSLIRKKADETLKRHLIEELMPLLAKAGFKENALGEYSDGRPTGGLFEKKIAKTDNGNVIFGLNIEFPENFCGKHYALQSITIRPYVNGERYIADQKGKKLKWEAYPNNAMKTYQKMINESQSIIQGLLSGSPDYMALPNETCDSDTLEDFVSKLKK